MTKEFLPEKTATPNLTDFLNLVVKRYRKNKGLVGIEEAAEIVLKKEEMKQFSETLPLIRDHLKEFLGPDRWTKLRNRETKRILEGDRATKGSTPG